MKFNYDLTDTVLTYFCIIFCHATKIVWEIFCKNRQEMLNIFSMVRRSMQICHVDNEHSKQSECCVFTESSNLRSAEINRTHIFIFRFIRI